MEFQEFGRRLALDRDVMSQEEVLVAALDSAQEVCLEDAALFHPGSGRWTALFYETVIGMGDGEGLEDAAAVSRDPEGLEVLLELREGLRGLESDAEAPFVVFWNCGGEALSVDGSRIAPGAYLTVRTLTGAEAVRCWNRQGRLEGGGV